MTDGRFGQVDDVELDMRALFAALGRALPFLVPLILIVACGLFFGLNFVTPRYTAESKILIEKGESSITQVAGDTEESRTLLDAEGVASQVQRIASRDLANSVVKSLNLAALPEFNGPTLGDRLNSFLQRFHLGRAATATSADDRVLQRFADRLEVYSVDKTRVITIAFSSSDPSLAARVSNAVADEYLALDRDAKRTTNADATRWLESQIADLRIKVTNAEAKVETFRTGSDLFMGGQNNNTSISQQKLTDLNTELVRLQAARAAATANAATLRRGLNSGSQLDVPEVIDSQLIQRLREQQVALRAQIAQLSVTLLPAHPRIKELNAQLGDLDTQVRREAQRIVSSLEGEVSTAKAREAEIGADIERAKAAAGQSNDAEVQLRALEREATADRDLLESYLRRYREATSRQEGDYLPADARVISRASVPLEPSFPRRLPITIAATVALLLLAIAFILIRELMSGRALRRIVFDPGPLVGHAAPVDGRLRWSEGGDVRRLMPAEPTLAPGAAPDAPDTLRELVDRIVDSHAKRVVISLAEAPVNGRPLAAVSLARQLSRRGNRVLLIDLHSDGADGNAMAASKETLPGFSDLYAGEASFAQAIFRDRQSRAHLIPRGISALPVDLAGTERFATILDALDHTYEHILLDVDQELAVSLAGSASAVVLVTESEASDPRTTRAYDALTAASSAEKVMLLIADVRPNGSAPDPTGSEAAA